MKAIMIEGQTLHLPNGLNDFQQSLYVQLIKWKWEHITQEAGGYRHNGKTLSYDAILPDSFAEREEMPHLYPAVQDSLRKHRQHNPFRIHQHFYHMASSQAANINLFLPLLHHASASKILSVIPGAPKGIDSLATDCLDKGYCIEYWGGNYCENECDSGLLGDKAPRSGTDSDIAIAYRTAEGELGLWLIEHKLTETEFTTCGGFKSKGRQECHDCSRSFEVILRNKNLCYYHDVRKFKYWDITGDNREFFVNHSKHAHCPFQGGMNQLWRNQLLGLAIERDGNPFKQAHFSVVHHPRNAALDKSLNEYKDLIGHNPKFSSFTSGDVIQAAERHADAELGKWIAWYKDLYWLSSET